MRVLRDQGGTAARQMMVAYRVRPLTSAHTRMPASVTERNP